MRVARASVLVCAMSLPASLCSMPGPGPWCLQVSGGTVAALNHIYASIGQLNDQGFQEFNREIQAQADLKRLKAPKAPRVTFDDDWRRVKRLLAKFKARCAQAAVGGCCRGLLPVMHPRRGD